MIKFVWRNKVKKLNKKEVESFIKQIRKLIFKSIKEEREEKPIKNETLKEVHNIILGKLKKVKLTNKDMDNFLTINESILILEDYSKKVDDHWIINDSEKNCGKIAQDLFSRIINNALSRLSAEGLLECHYDDEENDFIFNPIKFQS